MIVSIFLVVGTSHYYILYIFFLAKPLRGGRRGYFFDALVLGKYPEKTRVYLLFLCQRIQTKKTHRNCYFVFFLSSIHDTTPIR